MSLSLQAIDRLFDRLAATYGKQWFQMWEGIDPNAVKANWAHELSPFRDMSMHRIAWALDNLPARCPNAVEFRALCRQAPTPDEKLLPAPKADPKRVQAELEKLDKIMKQHSGSGGAREWARRILARHDRGAIISPGVLSMARAAQGVEE